MQALTQLQVNQLKNVLEYTKNRIFHPENPQHSYQILTTGCNTFTPLTAAQIREQAEVRAKNIESFEQFIKDRDEILMVINTLDYVTALEGATVTSTVEAKTALLGDLLSEPDKYNHLGKRQETPSLSPDQLN